jgi:hypothetical protein
MKAPNFMLGVMFFPNYILRLFASTIRRSTIDYLDQPKRRQSRWKRSRPIAEISVRFENRSDRIQQGAQLPADPFSVSLGDLCGFFFIREIRVIRG